MMKYILVATLIIYILLFFAPKFQIKINGQISNNLLYRIIGAAVFALIFFVAIGLPIYAVSTLFW